MPVWNHFNPVHADGPFLFNSLQKGLNFVQHLVLTFFITLLEGFNPQSHKKDVPERHFPHWPSSNVCYHPRGIRLVGRESWPLILEGFLDRYGQDLFLCALNPS
jgi:hypothetical protein